MIYILTYSDGMYPEDNCIIGVYDTEEFACEIRDNELKYYSKYPDMNKAKKWNYSIAPFEITRKEDYVSN